MLRELARSSAIATSIRRCVVMAAALAMVSHRDKEETAGRGKQGTAPDCWGGRDRERE